MYTPYRSDIAIQPTITSRPPNVTQCTGRRVSGAKRTTIITTANRSATASPQLAMKPTTDTSTPSPKAPFAARGPTFTTAAASSSITVTAVESTIDSHSLRQKERPSSVPYTRFSTCIVALIAPDTSQTAITAPSVTQKSWRWARILCTVSFTTRKTGADTFSFTVCAASVLHHSDRPNAPSRPSASSASGTSAKKTWNEIALA